MSEFKFFSAVIGFVLSSMFFSAAWVGRARQEAVINLGELAIEAARIEQKELETWGELCASYAVWTYSQNYQGPDPLGSNCDFLKEPHND